jgi:two-component system, LytTR family, sensor kinase
MENKTVIKIHAALWILASSISLLNTFVYIGNNLFLPVLTSVSLRLFCNLITFYVFYFTVSQRFFNKKGIFFLVIFGLFYITVFGIVFAFIYYLPIAYVNSPSDPVEYTLANGIKSIIFDVIAYLTIVAILGSLSKVSLIWYRNQIKQKEAEKQNISNELAMLKAQINPHFLFNTLNNIKSLIKSLPPKAIYSIDKLSGIMHYMFYESSFDTVPLKNEIGHINNYLELEKIRNTNPDFIDFKITGDYSGILIPPLIFMPFIENAFKHGNKLSNAPGIMIRLDVNHPAVHFEISNFIKENYAAPDSKSGFGLSNIRRRLDLLFGNKYDLKIVNENKAYSVNLNLILS